jgi:hypothetical protein
MSNTPNFPPLSGSAIGTKLFSISSVIEPDTTIYGPISVNLGSNVEFYSPNINIVLSNGTNGPRIGLYAIGGGGVGPQGPPGPTGPAGPSGGPIASPLTITGPAPTIIGSNGGPTTSLVLTIPSSSRIYTLPDVGADANVVLTEGNQTINGVKTFGSGILLPTVGGTPASFNYYEEFDYVSAFTAGLWTFGVFMSAKIIRTGKLVSMIFSRVGPATATDASSNVITTATPFPSRFRDNPAEDPLCIFIQTFANASFNTSTNPMTGLCKIYPTGVIEFYRNFDLVQTWPTATPYCGYDRFCASWTVP